MWPSDKKLKLIGYFLFLILVSSGCYAQHQTSSEMLRSTVISTNSTSTSIPTATSTATQIPSPTPTNTPVPLMAGKIAFLSASFDELLPKLNVINFECTELLDECKSKITHLADDISNLRAPSWSSDGKQIVVARHHLAPQSPGKVYIINADGSGKNELLNSDSISQPTWSPTNNLIAFFESDVGLQIVRADGGVPVTFMQMIDGSITSLNWSPDGKFLAFKYTLTYGGWAGMYVVPVDETKIFGQDNGLKDEDIFIESWGREPTWSPDGKRIAYVCDNVREQNICLLNLETKEHINLTNNSAIDDQPKWSPDGEHIAFISDREGNREIYIANADGTGETRLTNTAADEGEPNWSPSSKYIVFISNRDDTFTNCRITPSYAGSTRTAYYYLDVRCNYEIYIMKSDGTEQKRLTNNDTCDASPVWEPK